MLKSVADLTSQDFSKGLNTNSDIFKIEKTQSPNLLNVKVNFDGSLEKRLGTKTMNTVALETSSGWASFDFGATSLRWLVVSCGTGIYASQDLGTTFSSIASSRTSTYQYFERSKNVLVVGSQNYDPPLYWTGSAGTFMATLNSNAPLCKYFVNFQGFLIGLNSNTRKRGFFYEDENTQLTGTWANSFDLPSSQDDEVTGAIILRTRLYISTRYKIFRISFVGGNPDWSFREVKDWGFVPRTAKKISLGDIGEVITALSWDKRIRFFDGSDDKIASDNVENDNGICEFATEKISFAGSGLLVSHAEVDANENVYKLCCTIGTNSSQTTHFLNLDGRTLAFYPDNNRPFQTMVMAESANRRYLMAIDRSGYVHMVDTGNLDGAKTAVNDVFDSSYLFEKSPSQFSKGYKIDMYFSVNSTGSVFIQEATDFSDTFKTRHILQIKSSGAVQDLHSIDTPTSFNVYQYRVTSSADATIPWRLNRVDYFLQGMGIGKSN